MGEFCTSLQSPLDLLCDKKFFFKITVTHLERHEFVVGFRCPCVHFDRMVHSNSQKFDSMKIYWNRQKIKSSSATLRSIIQCLRKKRSQNNNNTTRISFIIITKFIMRTTIEFTNGSEITLLQLVRLIKKLERKKNKK